MGGVHPAPSSDARVGFFDVDELFVPAYPLQSIADVLADRVFRKVASAVFPRLLYGPDGHATPPNGTMLASYLRHVNP